MLRKSVTYTGFDDLTVVEDWYFNLTEAEIAQLALTSTDGEVDLSAKLRTIVAKQDPKEVLKAFEEILLLAVGQRSEDGKRFIKNQDIRDAFTQTGAYSEIFMELLTSGTAAAEFINGIIPKKLSESKEVKTQLSQIRVVDVKLDPTGPMGSIESATPAVEEDKRPAWLRQNRQPTRSELSKMPREELQLAYKIAMDATTEVL